jgi:hypothetical protein
VAVELPEAAIGLMRILLAWADIAWAPWISEVVRPVVQAFGSIPESIEAYPGTQAFNALVESKVDACHGVIAFGPFAVGPVPAPAVGSVPDDSDWPQRALARAQLSISKRLLEVRRKTPAAGGFPSLIPTMEYDDTQPLDAVVGLVKRLGQWHSRPPARARFQLGPAPLAAQFRGQPFQVEYRIKTDLDDIGPWHRATVYPVPDALEVVTEVVENQNRVQLRVLWRGREFESYFTAVAGRELILTETAPEDVGALRLGLDRSGDIAA